MKTIRGGPNIITVPTSYILSLGLKNYVEIVFLIQIIISIKFLVDKLMGRVATFRVRSLISLTVCGTNNLTDHKTNNGQENCRLTVAAL